MPSIVVTESLKDILRVFSRDELRRKAIELGVERGRDKEDTITNLAKSGQVTVEVKFVDVKK